MGNLDILKDKCCKTSKLKKMPSEPDCAVTMKSLACVCFDLSCTIELFASIISERDVSIEALVWLA
jgi:hypothetical protein